MAGFSFLAADDAFFDASAVHPFPVVIRRPGSVFLSATDADSPAFSGHFLEIVPDINAPAAGAFQYAGMIRDLVVMIQIDLFPALFACSAAFAAVGGVSVLMI